MQLPFNVWQHEEKEKKIKGQGKGFQPLTFPRSNFSQKEKGLQQHGEVKQQYPPILFSVLVESEVAITNDRKKFQIFG